MSLKATAVALAMGLAAVLPPVSGALAQRDRREVQPGQSIQAAIDAAPPGATIEVAPGTYQENLLIAKDGITLRGSGPGRTVLVPPAQPALVCVFPEGLILVKVGRPFWPSISGKLNLLLNVAKSLAAYGSS